MKNPVRYKPYSRYKASDVDWLGRIPHDWQIRKLKFAAIPDSRGSFGIKGNLGLEERDDLFPAFSAAGQDIWVERADYDGPGIVLSAIGARCGKCFKADGKWSALANTQVFLPNKTFFRDYLWYLVNRELFWLKGGSAQPYVQIPASINQKIPFPTFSEQRAIAEFLDRETAKIDELIAKKERLIELLEEKRAALITRAVTRGLNRDAPLRDSGIEWLGQIPKHWEVRRLAMAVDKITNGFVGPTRDILVTEGVRYLQSLHIKRGRIEFERKPYFVTAQWSKEHSKSVLESGDVLVVQTGDIGQVCPVTDDFAGANCHALIILRLKKGLGSGYYLSDFLRSDYGQNALKRAQTGALHPHLECGHVREIPVLLPPPDEQRDISRWIVDRTTEHYSLMQLVQRAIDRLKEYRAALITAAVTGKIDVRDEVKAGT